MGTVIKDRRHETPNDRFGTDRERFRNRYLTNIKKAIHDKIEEGSLDDLGKGGVKVPIPKETSHEPIIHHKGGDSSHVFPGNVSFDVGDKIKKPGSTDTGAGKGASADKQDFEDDFIWVNETELLDILFEGRSLPDMSKFKSENVTIRDREWAGHTNRGPDHKLDLTVTDRKRKEETLVLTKGAERRILGNLIEQFNILAGYEPTIDKIDVSEKPKYEREIAIKKSLQALLIATDNDNIVEQLQAGVSALKLKHTVAIPDVETHRLAVLEARLSEQFKSKAKNGNFQDRHLTYNYDDDVPRQNAKAVMFCQMDVSGSMTQEYKNTAKVFFWLLNKFLKEAYEEVDIVFISHTTTADEVDEQTFFYGTQTGGTMVSSCLIKTQEIIKERYDLSEWNVYSAQASDGDNYGSDNEVVLQVMEQLLPDLQGHYYIEIGMEDGDKSELLLAYESLSSKRGKLRTAGNVISPSGALKAFKDFFPVGGDTLSKTHSHFVPSR